MSITPTAHWPAPSLIRSLANAGWGELAGRQWQGVRTTLRALIDALPDKAAQGQTTVAQIADRAGLSSRWVRRCLHILEDAQLITWHRGHVEHGGAQPSFIRINKRRLVALITKARPLHELTQALRAAATRERLARLRTRWLKNDRPRFSRSNHVELNADLHPLRGGTGAAAAPQVPRFVDNSRRGAPECDHGVPILKRTPTGQPACPLCRRLLTGS